MTSAVVIAGLAALTGVACTRTDAVDIGDGGARGTVVRVVDGDTIVANIGGRHEEIRLIGIDTPETVHPDRPVECFGPEASDRTKALLPGGTAITVRRDVEARDVYGRLLLYVWRESDGTFVNLDLVERGFARPLTIEPNDAHSTDFTAAAVAAETGRLGLWQRCDG